MKTWTMLVEPEQPIPVNDLEINILNGNSLTFSFERAYEQNLLADEWNRFIQEGAAVRKEKLLKALKEGDDETFRTLIKWIGSDSSMLRFNDASINGNALDIKLAITGFVDYVKTNRAVLDNPKLRDILTKAGSEDFNDAGHYFANPLASLVVIETNDGYTPVGMRSDSVAIYPSVPHVPAAGYVKVNGANNPDFSVNDIDLYQNMLKELREELGVNKDQLTQTDFLGIVRNKETLGPEMIFYAKVDLTKDELLDSWSNASDKFEHKNITMYDKEGLGEFLKEWQNKMVPTGEAGLRLYLKRY